MANETLTIILAALTAFFTLITGALAVAVTIGILYFKKLAFDRQQEIKKLIELQDELANKMQESEKALQDLGAGKGDIARISNELDTLKREYFKISNQLHPRVSVYDYSQPSGEGTPTAVDLQVQIGTLLGQIQELQKQLVTSPEERAKDK